MSQSSEIIPTTLNTFQTLAQFDVYAFIDDLDYIRLTAAFKLSMSGFAWKISPKRNIKT